METAVQVSVLAAVAAIACLVLRKRSEELAVPLSLLAVALILLMGLRFISPVLDILRRLETLTALAKGVTEPMLKAVGIGILTEVSAGVCEDAGEGSLSGAVRASGSVMALYGALPLLSAVIDCLEDILR